MPELSELLPLPPPPFELPDPVLLFFLCGCIEIGVLVFDWDSVDVVGLLVSFSEGTTGPVDERVLLLLFMVIMVKESGAKQLNFVDLWNATNVRKFCSDWMMSSNHGLYIDNLLGNTFSVSNRGWEIVIWEQFMNSRVLCILISLKGASQRFVLMMSISLSNSFFPSFSALSFFYLFCLWVDVVEWYSIGCTWWHTDKFSVLLLFVASWNYCCMYFCFLQWNIWRLCLTAHERHVFHFS